MARSIIATEAAPKAIGTYSQAVRCGSTLYVSGQIPLDPTTGELVAGDVESQIRRVFEIAGVGESPEKVGALTRASVDTALSKALAAESRLGDNSVFLM